MNILYSLSYDRNPPPDEPLVQIIQILWSHGVTNINRYLETTLEFYISGVNDIEIANKAQDLADDLQDIAFIRLIKVCGIMGEGKESLNIGLEEFIETNILAGTLIKP